jgi:hypothetical protein
MCDVWGLFSNDFFHHLAIFKVLDEFHEVLEGSLWVKLLGASGSTHTNVLAVIKFQLLRKVLESLIGILISGVNHPSVGLHEDGGAKIAVWVPPVGGARSGTASAEDTFVKQIKLLSIFLALVVLLVVELGSLSLQVRLDTLILGIEIGHIHDEVLEYEHVAKWGNDRGLGKVCVNSLDASQRVKTIAIH